MLCTLVAVDQFCHKFLLHTSFFCYIFVSYTDMSCLCVADEREIKNLVLWLENQKIRRYKIEERGPLQADGNQWHASFEKYCKDLASPIVDGSMAEKLEWLIGYAVSLEYADNGRFFCFQALVTISACPAIYF